MDYGAADVAMMFVEDGFDALYTHGQSAPLQCRVMLDRGVQIFGDMGQVIGRRHIITFQAAQVPAPARGATVQALPPRSGTWVIDRVEVDDGYIVRAITQ